MGARSEDEECVCGLTLKTGCIVWAYLNLIGSIFACFTLIYFLSNANKIFQHQKLPEMDIIIKWVIGIVFIINIINMVFDWQFIEGIKKRKAGKMRGFMVFQLIILFGSALFCLKSILGMFARKNPTLAGIADIASFILQLWIYTRCSDLVEVYRRTTWLTKYAVELNQITVQNMNR